MANGMGAREGELDEKEGLLFAPAAEEGAPDGQQEGVSASPSSAPAPENKGEHRLAIPSEKSIQGTARTMIEHACEELDYFEGDDKAEKRSAFVKKFKSFITKYFKLQLVDEKSGGDLHQLILESFSSDAASRISLAEYILNPKKIFGFRGAIEEKYASSSLQWQRDYIVGIASVFLFKKGASETQAIKDFCAIAIEAGRLEGLIQGLDKAIRGVQKELIPLSRTDRYAQSVNKTVRNTLIVVVIVSALAMWKGNEAIKKMATFAFVFTLLMSGLIVGIGEYNKREMQATQRLHTRYQAEAADMMNLLQNLRANTDNTLGVSSKEEGGVAAVARAAAANGSPIHHVSPAAPIPPASSSSSSSSLSSFPQLKRD